MSLPATTNQGSLTDPILGQNLLLNISQDDLDNMDTEKLQELMMKSVFVIEASLFSQASQEHGRIATLRELIAKIERNIDVTTIDDHLKIMYHKSVAGTMAKSMDFLTKLHSSIAEGMDTVSRINAQRAEADKKRPTSSGEDLERQEKKNIVNEIRAEINRRISAKEAF